MEINMKILVTAIGSLAADIVIKSLHGAGHFVVGCDFNPPAWLVEAGQVDLFIPAPRADEHAAYKRFLLAVCAENGVEAVIPLTDPEVEVAAEFKNELAKSGTLACVVDYPTARMCRDKIALAEFINKYELAPVPPTQLVTAEMPVTMTYPLLAKPRYGRSSQGIMRIEDHNQFQYLMALTGTTEYIVQPFIGGNVITVDVVRDQQGNQACLARRELLRTLNGAGTTVEIIENEGLIDTCAVIADALGIIGAVNFEFIEHGDQLDFLEANPRLSGGVEFSHMAGYNVTINHLSSFFGAKIDPPIKPRPMIIARQYQEYITKIL